MIVAARLTMNIYLAGPDVFLPDALDVGRRKAEVCARYGLRGLYPLDNAVALAAHDASLQIFRGNEAMMDAADAIIANLTPFRGPSADAGTVYELGYMAGHGKLVLGYSNDPANYVARVARFEAIDNRDGLLVGADGLAVEDFGLSDNLMLIHALDLHGAPIVRVGEASDQPCLLDAARVGPAPLSLLPTSSAVTDGNRLAHGGIGLRGVEDLLEGVERGLVRRLERRLEDRDGILLRLRQRERIRERQATRAGPDGRWCRCSWVSPMLRCAGSSSGSRVRGSRRGSSRSPSAVICRPPCTTSASCGAKSFPALPRH